jgi:hypothetical protein
MGWLVGAVGIEQNAHWIFYDFRMLAEFARSAFADYEQFSSITIAIAAFCRLKKLISRDRITRYGSWDVGYKPVAPLR